MDGTVVTAAPSKRRKTETNYKLCIICQSSKSSEPKLVEPKLESLENLLAIVTGRHKFGDASVSEFVFRIKASSPADIRKNGGMYHRSCFKDFGNKSKLEHAKARCEKAMLNESISLAQCWAGKPSLGSPKSTNLDEVRALRSKAEPFDKDYYMSKRWREETFSCF